MYTDYSVHLAISLSLTYEQLISLDWHLPSFLLLLGDFIITSLGKTFLALLPTFELNLKLMVLTSLTIRFRPFLSFIDLDTLSPSLVLIQGKLYLFPCCKYICHLLFLAFYDCYLGDGAYCGTEPRWISLITASCYSGLPYVSGINYIITIFTTT